MRNKIMWTHLNRSLDFSQEAIMHTALGPFSLSDEANPINMFQFEIMNTNFRIMKSMVGRLNQTAGVEAIAIFSPYSIAVAMGKLFDKNKTKQLIELRLIGKIVNNIKIEDVPENIREKATSKFGNLIFPNGEILKLDADSLDDKEVYERCAELVGGIYYENS